MRPLPLCGHQVSPLIGVELFLIDDGTDVADEESRGPEGMADVPGEGCWGNWIPAWFCLY